MKIHLRPPPGVVIEVEEVNRVITDVIVTPDFPAPKSAPSFLHGTVETDGGDTKDCFLLFVSGASANVSLRKRNKSSKALVDMTPEELAQQGGEDEEDDSDGTASTS